MTTALMTLLKIDHLPIPWKFHESPLKRPPQTNTTCAQIPLTHNLLPSILPLPNSQFLLEPAEREILVGRLRKIFGSDYS